MLRNCKDKKYIKEVLEHLNTFPEVIIDSHASIKQRYDAILMVADNVARLQNDPDESRTDNCRFNALCGRLIYLATKGWPHLPESLDSKSTFYLERIEELSDLHS